MSYKKISPVRLADLPGPRRQKPPVRAVKRKRDEVVAREREIVGKLLSDRAQRIAYCGEIGVQPDGLLVVIDFDQTGEFTETNTSTLPEWSEITEYMKVHVGFMAALAVGGYGFSSDIHPAHIEKWVARGTVRSNIEKRLRTELVALQLGDLPFTFVVEGYDKSGKERTKLHLHGYVVTANPQDMLWFKVAVERALHTARGKPDLPSTAWNQQMAYDIDVGDGRGHGRWGEYIMKNVDRYDERIPGRRVYFSVEMKTLMREMWALVREEPYEGELAFPVDMSCANSDSCSVALA